MTARVELIVSDARGEETEYVFGQRTMCLVGRADNCLIQFRDDDEHLDISRNHCVLDINPPDVAIRDLGSRNGTFVNGTRIGRRADHQGPEDIDPCSGVPYELQDHDEIRVGQAVLRVRVAVPEEVVELG